MRRAIPFVVGAVVLAAGCGGSRDHSPQETRACLKEEGVRIGGMLDFVASTATGGAFVAHLGDNFVTVVFGESASDGEEIENAYKRFAFDNVRSGLPDVLKRDGNTVMLWHEHPADDELATVNGCLR